MKLWNENALVCSVFYISQAWISINQFRFRTVKGSNSVYLDDNHITDDLIIVYFLCFKKVILCRYTIDRGHGLVDLSKQICLNIFMDAHEFWFYFCVSFIALSIFPFS